MFEKIQQNVIEAVENQLEMDPADINGETSLTEELKLDSLDFVEVCIALEDIYGVEFDTEELSKSMSASTTVNDVVEYLISLGVN